MILLNGTLCSKNFRKAGLIQSSVNLATQILCLAILCKVIIEASPYKRGYFVHGHRINKKQEKSITNILIDIMLFIVLDIIAYLWLIFGLLKKKRMILTGWLLFSVMELIVVLISSLYFAVYLTFKSNSGASVLGLIIPILVTLYMTYNICVIYTFRFHLIREGDPTFPFNTHAILVNPSTISYPQYRIPHTPYIPNTHQVSSGCQLHGIRTGNCNASFVDPPSYDECHA